MTYAQSKAEEKTKISIPPRGLALAILCALASCSPERVAQQDPPQKPEASQTTAQPVQVELIPYVSRLVTVEVGIGDTVASLILDTGGSGSFTGGESSSANRRPVDPGRFPRFVPPFEGDYLPAAPWGDVWVRVDVLSGPTLTVFDVFDEEGNHLRRVSLKGDARVVGYGSSVVYVARKDEYDLEWLEQYAGSRKR